MTKYTYCRAGRDDAEHCLALTDTLAALRPGDTLVVESISEVATTRPELRAVLACLEDRHAALSVEFTLRRPGETAEQGFFRDLQRAQTRKAIVAGRYKNCTGRPRTADRVLIRRLLADGLTPSEVEKITGVSQPTISRAKHST